MSGTGVTTRFTGSLAGFDKEMKNLVIESVRNGWNGRLSSQGHAVLSHPSGLTVTVGKSSRYLQAARSSIRRVEESKVAPPGWYFVGDSKRVLSDGVNYRCSICDFTANTAAKVTGHFVGNHVDRKKMTEGRDRKKQIDQLPIKFEEEHLEVAEEKEEVVADIEENQPKSELQESIQDLIDWFGNMPTAALAQVLELADANKRLQEENRRLKESFSTLISLAKEVEVD